MAIPLLISMAAIGVSVMFPPKGKNSGTPESPTRSLLIPIGVESNQSLVAGIVMGVGLSLALNYELKRSRLYERIRLAIQSWLRPLVLQQVPPPGKSFSVLTHATTTRQPNNTSDDAAVNGQENIQTIISSDTSLTSSLWVSTIRIPPRCQLDMKPSNGLELFYVLQGSGEWGSQQIQSTAATESGDSVTMKEPLVAGEALVVEPNRTRWIANTSRLGDMVLLRSSDAGHLHRQSGSYDEIVPISSSSGNSAAGAAVTNSVSSMVSSGLQMLGGYMGSTKQEEKTRGS